MPEVISDRKVFSLIEVTESIQKTLTDRYKSSFWLKAEMNKLNHYSHSGHCYPDLVEKREGKVIAQMRSILWKSDYFRLNETFKSMLKEPLKDGIKILLCATITFDSTHGLSLRILDIDPGFSLGELEREKQEAIMKLNKEGIFSNNKNLTLPLLPQRIAIISVETSKGYADYLQVIDNNPWGYKFFNFLFPSLLQGEKSIISIISQLKRIRKVIHHFDVVAIIRGGGGDVGLSSFNNYELAREIALFPLPVITGIGHSTNETVSEMVSSKNAITPTELADFLIQKFHNFSVPVRKAEETIIDKSSRLLKEEKLKLHNEVKFFQTATRSQLLKNYNTIRGNGQTLKHQVKFFVRQESHLIHTLKSELQRSMALLIQQNTNTISQLSSNLQQNAVSFIKDQNRSLYNSSKQVSLLDPQNILNRGFTITLYEGKTVKSFSELKAGDTITTVLAEGKIVSNIIETTNSPDQHE